MKSSASVSKRAAALIIAASCLSSLLVYAALTALTPAANGPVVESLGGFDRFGNLEGLRVRVGARMYTCGGPDGAVVCRPLP